MADLPPMQPSMLGQVHGFIWSSKLRKSITVTAGTIAAVLACYTQIKANADDLEHFYPASRPYARVAAETAAQKALDAVKAHEQAEKVSSAKVDRVLYHIRVEQADGKREAATSNLFKAQRDYKAALHELDRATDPQTKQFIQSQADDLAKQIEDLQATKAKIEKSIETLNKAAAE